MKILVTGAEGFVGGHLVEELSEHEVIASDIGDANLAESGRADVLVNWHKPDYVVHLAARYGRLLCRDAPHHAVSDNAAATTEIAAACAENDIPILYTSSSEVYGDHGEATITEESTLRMPTTIYGLSKLWGEQALGLYENEACIVRMNMLHGPRQQSGYGRCALANFIHSAMSGEPFEVHGDASRSWLYIGDAVRALRLLIEGRHTGIFNLGNSHELHSMVELAGMVRKETDCDPSLIQVRKAPPGQIRHKRFDCSLVESTIDWRAEVDVREGIRKTLAHIIGGGSD